MLQRFDRPALPVDPYPVGVAKVTAFRYDSALVLLRLKDAVKLRNGEDADYLTGRPFLVSWQDAKGEWRQISVPAGLVTDLTSVPRVLRAIIGRVGPWLEAAIVHDYLYIAWQDIADRTPRDENRQFADDIMLAAMNEARVMPWMARVIHWAVSTFGGKAYSNRTEDRYVDLGDPEIQSQLALRVPRTVDVD